MANRRVVCTFSGLLDDSTDNDGTGLFFYYKEVGLAVDCAVWTDSSEAAL